MRYAVEKAEKYTILTLNEDKLDTTIAPMVKAEIVNMFETGTVNLVFDLSQVKYVDSSGLSALLLANRCTNEIGGNLVLTGVHEHVMKLIVITRLDMVFEILPTVEEGIDNVYLRSLEKDLNREKGE